MREHQERNQGLPSVNPAEIQLVEQAVKGDTSAIDRLCELHYKEILRFIWLKIRNKQDAEDLTQKVFEKALRNLEGFTQQGVPYANYLKIIAQRLVTNYFRDNRRIPVTFDLNNPITENTLAAPKAISPAGRVLVRERDALLRRAIDCLPKAQRQVVELKLDSGWKMSNLAIAQLLQKTEQGIKSLYVRALRTLKKNPELEDYLREKEEL